MALNHIFRKTNDTDNDKTKLQLLYEVGKKVGSITGMSDLLEKITLMTQRTLNATAASVILINDESGNKNQDQELFFEIALGSAGKSLRQIKLHASSGITGWVARHKKPVIINDVARDTRFNSSIDQLTGFVTKSIICVPMILSGRLIGIIEVLNKNDGEGFNEQDLETLVCVASTYAIIIDNTRLHNQVIDAYKSTIKALAAAIDAKDPYTCGHSQRVMEYSLKIGYLLSLNKEEMETLEYASILHDIGKIGISDQILNKPGMLTPEEWSIMREHSAIGANMIKTIPFLENASDIVLHHHERWDGKGYPNGLKGTTIPLGARIIAVADTFDTMTTNRAYRSALPVDYAISELICYAGTQFCHSCVNAFVSSYNGNNKITSQTVFSGMK
jgi:HD-GYP domain-containing protein (c-di-GMP phosphodiesterase class II)